MKRGGLLLILSVLTACWSNEPAPKTPSAKVEPEKLSVDAVVPKSGDASGGEIVRIRGHRFTADGARRATVYFGDRVASDVRFESDSEISVTTPIGIPDGAVDVRVHFEPGGELTVPKAFAFTWDSTGESVMNTMRRFADRMCACTDTKCAQDVSDDMTKWSQEMSKKFREPPKMSEEMTKEAYAIGERMGRCMQQAMSAP